MIPVICIELDLIAPVVFYLSILIFQIFLGGDK